MKLPVTKLLHLYDVATVTFVRLCSVVILSLGLSVPLTYAAALVCFTITIPGNPELDGVFGTSDTNVIAVGRGPIIYQFDGESWTAMSVPAGADDLKDVFVLSATRAFAVGKKGEVLYYNGAWSRLTQPTNQELRAVWAFSDTEVYVAGKKGALYVGTGGPPPNTWTDLSVIAGVSNEDIEALWGDSNYLYVLNKIGVIYRLTRASSTWTTYNTCNISNDIEFKGGLWGDSSGNVYLSGKDKSGADDVGVVYRFDPTGPSCTLQATASQLGTDLELFEIFGNDNGEIYVVGKKGVILHFDGSSWTQSFDGNQDINDVWVSSAGQAYYAGKKGETTVCRLPLVEYRMDEGGWNGTSGEVTDSSGYINGTAANGATTADGARAVPGSPGTCRYGAFDGNNDHVTLAGFPNRAKDFTITAWIRTTNNTKSGQRIFIDDENNSGGYGLSLGDPGTGRLRFYARSTSPISLDTGNVIANNTWYFVSAVADITNSIKYIYVYDTSGNLLASVSSAITGTWGTDIGTASIGGETDASSENPPNFYFQGNLDEVRFYKGAMTAAQVDSVRQETHDCIILDHYAINHSGTGVNCQAEPVTITAHDVSHNPVMLSSSNTITLSTSTALGDWALITGSGLLNNGAANDGAATYQFGAETNVVLSLKHTTPAPAPGVNINVVDGAISEDASEDVGLIFAPSGFRFTDGTNPVTIGTQISAKESNLAPGAQSLYLQAIRTDTTTGACVGVFSSGTSVNIDMASQCNNPTTCVAGKQVSLTNNAITTAIASNPDTAVSSYTTVPLLFGANSQALFSFNYPDAGAISLHARYNIPLEGGGPSPDTMYGSSNTFVVRPFGFRVTDPPSGRSGPGSAVFTSAGTLFNTTLTAVVWEAADDVDSDGVPDNQSTLAANATTPNFGQETAAATSTLSHTFAEPVGGAPGALSGTTTFTGFISGARTESVAFSEVGIIGLLATTSNYLGSGQDINAGINGLTGVGRFTPAYFDVTRTHGCTVGNFTYSGQPFTVTATAFNDLGAITANYHGAFSFSKDTTISDAGDASNFTNNVFATADFVNGVNSQTDVTYTFPVKQTAPLTITLRATDTDSVNSSGHIEQTTEERSGRMVLRNTYGPELVDLPMRLRAQYYSGVNGFSINDQDSCTSIGIATLTLSNGSGSFPGPGPIAVGTQTTSASIAYDPLMTGKAGLEFSEPGEGGDDYVDVTVDLSTQPWLRYDWDGNGVHDNDPEGRVTFGIYKGNTHQIYRSERY